jgi:hypothetical protein
MDAGMGRRGGEPVVRPFEMRGNSWSRFGVVPCEVYVDFPHDRSPTIVAQS